MALFSPEILQQIASGGGLDPRLLQAIMSNTPLDPGMSAGPQASPPAAAPAATPVPGVDAAGAPPPADMTRADLALPVSHPGFLRNFLGNYAAMGGASPQEVQDMKDPGLRERALTFRANQAAKLFPNNPTAQALWMQGDPDLMKALAEREKPQMVKEGDTLAVDGKPVLRGRKTVVGTDGGYGYTGDDVGGVKYGAQRGPTYDEQTNAAKAKIDQQRADQEGAHLQSQDDVEQAKATENKVVQKVAREGIGSIAGDPAATAIWRAYLVKQAAGVFEPDKVAADLMGVSKAPPAPGAKPSPAPAAATPDMPAIPAPATDPNGKPWNPKGVYNLPGKDGKTYAWRYVHGTLVRQR